MNALKLWFYNLSQREKMTVGLGGVVAVILIFYMLLWSPLTTHVTSLRQQIGANQQLLVWMQHAKGRVLSAKRHQRQPVGNIMVLAEHRLAEVNLASYLKQVQQPQQNQVSIQLAKVPFDQLVQAISQLSSHYALYINSFKVTKAETLGTVNAEFTLQKI